MLQPPILNHSKNSQVIGTQLISINQLLLNQMEICFPRVSLKMKQTSIYKMR